MGDDQVLDDHHADIVVLWHHAADQAVGLVDEDDLHGTEVTGGAAGLANLHTGLLVKFLKKNRFNLEKNFQTHVENLRSRLGEERWPDKVRVAAATTETELETAGGEDEVPAQLLEVHLDLVHTAGLGLVLLRLGGANVPGTSGVTFVELVVSQLLLSSSGYELPRQGEELLHEPLEDVLRPQHSHLLAGEVLREKER